MSGGRVWGQRSRRGYREATYGDPGAMSAMAQANGWNVGSELPPEADGRPARLAGGPLGPPGVDWRTAGPVVLGRAGWWPFIATTALARSRANQLLPYAVTALRMAGRLAPVHVYPERWRAQLTAVMPEVNLESGAFNDHLAVFSPDRRTAYGVLSPRTMEYLLEAERGGWLHDELWTWENYLCVARADGHTPHILDLHLRLLTVCAGDLPTSLWDPATPPPPGTAPGSPGGPPNSPPPGPTSGP